MKLVPSAAISRSSPPRRKVPVRSPGVISSWGERQPASREPETGILPAVDGPSEAHAEGRHRNPPERAVVLCVDEKSQVQALDRSQPVLPRMPERRTHDYLLHGVTSLLAAFDVGADGRPDAVGMTRPASEVARPLRRQPSVKVDGYAGFSDVPSIIQDHLVRALHKVLKNNSDQWRVVKVGIRRSAGVLRCRAPCLQGARHLAA
jgi:hypothetical protein